MIISKRLRAIYTSQLRAVFTRQLRAVYTSQLRAVYTLALCLTTGSVNADFDSAAEIYRKNDYLGAMKEFQVLAENGDARAQTVLALMYKYGEGTPLDHSLSFYWYMKAAELNYAPAQYHAGIMLAEGLGVEANLGEAVHWLTRSAEGGYYRANDKLELYNAARVSIDSTVDQYIPWSKHWDFSLPNDIRFPPPRLAESTTKKSFRVQLGAMSSLETAEILWQFLTKIRPSKFAGFNMMIEESARADQTFYRLQTGPFSSFQQAKTFCQALVDNQIRDCIPLQRQF
jgi:TPR repeat protein